MEFDAEAKRSWFSLRESLRGTRSRGSIWLPARVHLSEAVVRISTNEWIEEFRVAHSIRKGSRTVLLSGFQQGNAKRRTVKFNTPADAQQMVSMVGSFADVRQENQLEQATELETPLEIRNLIPKTLPLVFAPLLLLPILVVIIIFFGLSYVFFLPLTIAFLIYRVFLGGVWFFYDKMVNSSRRGLSNSWLSRPVTGWLRVQDGYLMLKTHYGWMPHEPQKIEWKDSRSLVLRTKHESMFLSFFKDDDAASTVRKLKNEVPSMQEIFPKEYQCGKSS